MLCRMKEGALKGNSNTESSSSYNDGRYLSKLPGEFALESSSRPSNITPEIWGAPVFQPNVYVGDSVEIDTQKRLQDSLSASPSSALPASQNSRKFSAWADGFLFRTAHLSFAQHFMNTFRWSLNSEMCLGRLLS